MIGRDALDHRSGHVIPWPLQLACAIARIRPFKPVSIDVMYQRLDHWRAGHSISHFGGNRWHPTWTHRRVRSAHDRRMITRLPADGERIQRLNRAGLIICKFRLTTYAGRGFEEEPEGARQETAAASDTRFPREH